MQTSKFWLNTRGYRPGNRDGSVGRGRPRTDALRLKSLRVFEKGASVRWSRRGTYRSAVERQQNLISGHSLDAVECDLFTFTIREIGHVCCNG
jgi:hypothetical protein